MLYKAFTIMMMLCALVGGCVMLYNSEYTFLIFPIAILIGGIYYFFEEDDKEYLKANGIDVGEFYWLDPNSYSSDDPFQYDTFGTSNRKSVGGYPSYHQVATTDHTSYMPPTQRKNDAVYKVISAKCKTNVNVSVVK